MICNTDGHQLRPECTQGHVGEYKLTDVFSGGSLQKITCAEAMLCVGENNAAPVVKCKSCKTNHSALSD